MIHTSKVIWLAALPALAALPVAAAPQAPLKFPTPNGHVVYRVTGSGPFAMNGTATTTWANYGQKFRQDTQMNVSLATGPNKDTLQNKSNTINTWAIYDGQYIYNEVPGIRKVLRTKPTQDALKKMFGMGSMDRTGIGSIGSSGKAIGRTTLLGKPVTIRVSTSKTPAVDANNKVWMWGGLTLREEIVMKFKFLTMFTGSVKSKGTPQSSQVSPTNMTTVATNLNTNVTPSPSLFRVPAGYSVQDEDDYLKGIPEMPAPHRTKQKSSTH